MSSPDSRNKFINNNQIWALSKKGNSVFTLLINAGLDNDLAFELTIKLLGEVSALELDQDE